MGDTTTDKAISPQSKISGIILFLYMAFTPFAKLFSITLESLVFLKYPLNNPSPHCMCMLNMLERLTDRLI